MKKEDYVSFGGLIPAKLKDDIDALLMQCHPRIPMGVAVETLARWMAGLTPDELKTLCYGKDGLTLAAFVDRRIAAFLASEQGKHLLSHGRGNGKRH